MDKFREKIIRHRIFYIMLAIMSVIFIIIATTYNGSDLNQTNSLATENNIADLFAGMLGVAIMRIIQITTYLKDDEKLRKQYIKQSDERTKNIREKSFSTSFNIYIVLACIGMVISDFFNPYVAMTLQTTVIIMIAINILTYLYFSKKY